MTHRPFRASISCEYSVMLVCALRNRASAAAMSRVWDLNDAPTERFQPTNSVMMPKHFNTFPVPIVEHKKAV